MLSQNENLKRCSKCDCEQDRSCFSKSKTSKDKLQGYCKTCAKAYRSNWADDNPDILRGYALRYRAESRKPCVYQLMFSDGSAYIGSTVQNFQGRLAVHKSKIKSKTHTNAKFNTYEEEDVTGMVLAYFDDETTLRQHEYVMIKHYTSLYKDKCLNSYNINVAEPKEIDANILAVISGSNYENKRQEGEDDVEMETY